MTGEVIKSYLVGLGFGVDDASLAKFNQSIASATLKVTALYATVNAAATGIVYGISEISAGFEQMGYEYHIIAPAINKALVLRQELLKAYSAAGINITKTIQASIKLNMSLAKTRFAFEAIYKSVGSKFFGLLTKQSDVFRQKIYQNMPKILAVLERFVKFVFKAVEATTALGLRVFSILSRVYDFFVDLDKATDGWSTKILAVLAAWELLNLEFLATPLGALIAGLVTLLALYDDFKTFQEGGQSLFNWSSFVPVIDSVKDALASLYGVLEGIGNILGALASAFVQLFRLDLSGFFDGLKGAASGVLDVITKLWSSFQGLLGVAGSLGAWTAGLLGGSNIAANPIGAPQAAPIGVGGSQNSQTNQHVQQQTQINVTGSADANAVGKAVAGEQSRVNFDLTRNMKGATR